METDEVTITCDRCPYRGQNLDYSKYLVTALFFESYRVDAWEADKDHMDDQLFHGHTVEASPEFRQSLETLLNAGEDEDSLRKYKEAARKLLNLPPQDVEAQVV